MGMLVNSILVLLNSLQRWSPMASNLTFSFF